MKSVLMIDGSPLFMEYIKEKLTAEQLTVETASGKRDAYTKMISGLPDLILINVENEISDYSEFFENKFNDPNCRKISIIMTGPKVDHAKTAQLLQYGVVKYFARPIKFDLFFEAVSKILNQHISIDPTPCTCEVHSKGSCIFIELSKGLNREKIHLLKYKISDILDAAEIEDPKIVIMFSNIRPTYIDGINLELLFDTVLSDSRIKAIDTYALTTNQFIKDLITGHPEYNSINQTGNLIDISTAIADTGRDQLEYAIMDNILTASEVDFNSSVDTRFSSDLPSSSLDGSTMSVAIVDDDHVIRKQLNNAFSAISAKVTLFAEGKHFLNSLEKNNFDIVILDIVMPGLTGFDVLNQLKNMGYTTPIIIYSQSTQREIVIQSLSLGAKSYLVKPQKPEVIVQKALSILNSK